jgi:OOP family OmpA-OmpF porin
MQQHGSKGYRRRTGWMALALAGLVAAGCSSVAGRSSDAEKAQGDAAFPDPSHSLMPEGSFVNLDNLRNVSVGMTKKQLYALLGTPHFNEGVIGVRQWNYLFDFHAHEGGTITCQYQVQFDKDHRASALLWKPAACQSVLDQPAPAVVAQAQPLPKEPIRLSTDALFDFNHAELTAQGRRQLETLLQRVSAASEVEDIQVVGFTDRIGSDAYNLDLSQRRAQAVSNFLMAGGVPAAAIHSEGRGKASPVVQCAQKARAPLIACLAPNRRVEISGMARALP